MRGHFITTIARSSHGQDSVFLSLAKLVTKEAGSAGYGTGQGACREGRQEVRMPSGIAERATEAICLL